MLVIRLGNIGIVTVILSLVLTFVNVPSPQEQTMRFFWLLAGLGLLFLLARSDWIDAHQRQRTEDDSYSDYSHSS